LNINPNSDISKICCWLSLSWNFGQRLLCSAKIMRAILWTFWKSGLFSGPGLFGRYFSHLNNIKCLINGPTIYNYTDLGNFESKKKPSYTFLAYILLPCGLRECLWSKDISYWLVGICSRSWLIDFRTWICVFSLN
jgi:hypothetical protein